MYIIKVSTVSPPSGILKQKLGKTTKTAELQTAEPVELAEPTEPREMTVFTDNYLSNFSPADWSRAIVDNSTDHGNEVMVAQFVFSFPQAIFREKSTEMDEKNCQCYCKNKWTTTFHDLYSIRP